MQSPPVGAAELNIAISEYVPNNNHICGTTVKIEYGCCLVDHGGRLGRHLVGRPAEPTPFADALRHFEFLQGLYLCLPKDFSSQHREVVLKKMDKFLETVLFCM